MQHKGTALPAGQGQSPHELPAEEQPLKVAEVAKFLRSSPDTIYDWIRKGELPHQRIGGTYYIPRWALAPLLPPVEAASAPTGGEAA
jgi:excisionase family DNA binding protein